ncbi:hypothetical protein K439DRAFT_1637833 [Ramaria rubella]|nr:hypothetical protein K439DRAFT_1637833 [Ramaria rubella]
MWSRKCAITIDRSIDRSGAVRGGRRHWLERQSVGHAYCNGCEESLPPFRGCLKVLTFKLAVTWIVDATGVDTAQPLRLSLSVSSSKAHLRKLVTTHVHSFHGDFPNISPRTVESVAHGKNLATIACRIQLTKIDWFERKWCSLSSVASSVVDIQRNSTIILR